MTDRMSDPTPTCRLGVTVTPRRPGFDFEGLDHEVPRAWHPAGIGPTAFLEALSAMAPVVESFFIDDARRLLPRIAEAASRAEVDAFLRQEAAHASMHAAFNRVLIRWGAPGYCGVDGAPSPPTIGPISTRGGTSTTGASCRSSATPSSIPHGRSERTEPPRGGRATSGAQTADSRRSLALAAPLSSVAALTARPAPARPRSRA